MVGKSAERRNLTVKAVDRNKGQIFNTIDDLKKLKQWALKAAYWAVLIQKYFLKKLIYEIILIC